jgi:hypothetical protein
VQVAELDVTHSPLNPLLPSGIGTGTHKPKT